MNIKIVQDKQNNHENKMLSFIHCSHFSFEQLLMTPSYMLLILINNLAKKGLQKVPLFHQDRHWTSWLAVRDIITNCDNLIHTLC